MGVLPESAHARSMIRATRHEQKEGLAAPAAVAGFAGYDAVLGRVSTASTKRLDVIDRKIPFAADPAFGMKPRAAIDANERIANRNFR